MTVERSHVDARWCVATRYRETLCPWWFVPLACICMALFWPSDRRNYKRFWRGVERGR